MFALSILVGAAPASPALALAEGLVITMGGDVNFNKHSQAPDGSGVVIHGHKVSFESMIRDIDHLLDGDLNFANIETVVTDRLDLRGQEKTFTFQSHPNAIRAMIARGFDLFSLANNHSYDYGREGLKETWFHFSHLRRERPDIAFAGGGRGRDEAAQPMVFERNGYTIAFAAIGIINRQFRATDSESGLLDYLDDADYRLQLEALRNVQADLKILSIHTGTEKQVTLNAGQRQRFHRAVIEGDVDLVIGHHPHVVRPVEMVNGKLIFYSLGNYIMAGAANIDERKPGYDYALFARAYFGWDSQSRRLKAQAVEAVPLKRMHVRPAPVSGIVGQERVDFLNSLSRQQVGSDAVLFTPRQDGSGVACASHDTAWTERAKKICSGSRVLP